MFRTGENMCLKLKNCYTFIMFTELACWRERWGGVAIKIFLCSVRICFIRSHLVGGVGGGGEWRWRGNWLKTPRNFRKHAGYWVHVSARYTWLIKDSLGVIFVVLRFASASWWTCLRCHLCESVTTNFWHWNFICGTFPSCLGTFNCTQSIQSR